MPIANALTVDVEDWYHGCCDKPAPTVAVRDRRVALNTERILRLLSDYRVKATFFVLGTVAEDEPTLVPMIAAEGHEIASHGYSHTLVPQLGPQSFRDEVRRTTELLAEQCGRKPLGFRAPQWSLGLHTPWALEILREEGFRYDSSFNPLAFIGDLNGPRTPFTINTWAGSLLELPPMVTPTPLGNLPSGGGWGFRFFPFCLIKRTVQQLNAEGKPALLYLHPREMEADGPRLSLSPLRTFLGYGPKTDATPRLREILRSFSFQTLQELSVSWKPA